MDTRQEEVYDYAAKPIVEGELQPQSPGCGTVSPGAADCVASADAVAVITGADAVPGSGAISVT